MRTGKGRIAGWALIAGCLALLGCSREGEDAAPAEPSDIAGAVQPEPPCGADERMKAWCGFRNPEDLAVTPDGRYLLATGFGGLPDPITNEMALFDLETRSKAEIAVELAGASWGDPACERASTELSPHGLSLVRRDDGRHQVAITNHRPRETIELFELASDGGQWRLTWRGCVDAPDGAMFNDVALTRDGAFYATEMYDAGLPFEELIEAGRNATDTGSVWHWDPDAGYSKVPGTQGSFPNGIALSADASVLFVNYWFSGRTIRLDPASGTIEAEHTGGKADNLTRTGDSLWAAKHDTTIDEFLEACPPEAPACDLPFTIYELSTSDLSVKRAWSFSSNVFGFATVAVPARGRVWLGTAHGERIASFAPEG